ncbi:H/ACA ribonucleoprotein complex non-core subunit NAF1 [Patella vulgata]|uniref:H/ACA ribonucleoprotein complex non-core subunit NAF1 n=1 Tax=Patella vulgata TaxID=6465 RepID=UPI00217FBAE6|nr:H/ACA ribonucleoprotein complex non-core subunit NAF1 [Patella vulgata]
MDENNTIVLINQHKQKEKCTDSLQSEIEDSAKFGNETTLPTVTEINKGTDHNIPAHNEGAGVVIICDNISESKTDTGNEKEHYIETCTTDVPQVKTKDDKGTGHNIPAQNDGAGIALICDNISESKAVTGNEKGHGIETCTTDVPQSPKNQESEIMVSIIDGDEKTTQLLVQVKTEDHKNNSVVNKSVPKNCNIPQTGTSEINSSDLTEVDLKVKVEDGVVCDDPMLCHRSVPDNEQLHDSGTEADNSSDSSSLFSDEVVSDNDETKHKLSENKIGIEVVRTKGEMLPEDLPPIGDLKITIPEDEKLLMLGKVSSVVGLLVVIQSSPNTPALNEESVLFYENRNVFGKVFEIFGPVACPFYSVRFNNSADIKNQNIEVGDQVYCAPNLEELTQYIFIDQLKQMKGSDASWKDNNEPPPKHLDYSDDELERRTKSKKREKKNDEVEQGDDSKINKTESRQERELFHKNRKVKYINKKKDWDRPKADTFSSEGNTNNVWQCWPPPGAGPPRHPPSRFQHQGNQNPFMMSQNFNSPHNNGGRMNNHGGIQNTRMNFWPQQPMNSQPPNYVSYQNFPLQGRMGNPNQFFPSPHPSQINPNAYMNTVQNHHYSPRPVIMDSRFVQNQQTNDPQLNHR